ncbi:MAG: cold shock domain-containing protein, partial [Gammaproteobacteria bacterium]
KWFDTTKAYGFIKPDEGDKDIFVHQSDLIDGTINENDKVEFETEDGPKGIRATQVKAI